MKYIIIVLFLTATTVPVLTQHPGNYDDLTGNTNISCCAYYNDECKGYYRICCCKDFYYCDNCCRKYNAISDTEFRELISNLNDLWFESDRIDLTKENINYYFFTSRQAKRLLEQLWFESSKMEIAKNIYPKILDKNNFHIIYDSFIFNSSVSELKEFVKYY